MRVMADVDLFDIFRELEVNELVQAVKDLDHEIGTWSTTLDLYKHFARLYEEYILDDLSDELLVHGDLDSPEDYVYVMEMRKLNKEI